MNNINTSFFNQKIGSNNTDLFGYAEPVSVVSTRKLIDPKISQLIVGPRGEYLYDELFGFDIEWKPIKEGDGHYNPTALIQIFRPGVSVIFRMNKLVTEHELEFGKDSTYEFPESLKNFIEDARFKKSGININQDGERLKRDFNVNLRGHSDIKDLEEYKKIGRVVGMKYLAKKYLDLNISKALATSNWEEKFLTRKQICYAATDSYLSRELFIAMNSSLGSK